MIGLLILCVGLAGCDRLFGLQHVTPDAAAGDGACAEATGVPTTKVFGGRTGGVAATGATDTFVSNDTGNVTNNFGALDRIFVCNQCICGQECDGVAGDDDDVVGMLRFDLAAEIPVCSQVIDATLILTTTTDDLGVGSGLLVYGVLEAWDEGVGALATGVTGVASWNERKPGIPWSQPGVGPPDSRAGVQIAAFNAPGDETQYPAAVDVTIVQRWVDDPSTNHGMALVVSLSTFDVHFHSREAADPAKRPGLEVVYMPP